MGNGVLIDAMMKDGLTDAYTDAPMGQAGELCARECGIPREAQDEYAVLSYRRAQEAQAKGWFRDEIVAVEVEREKGKTEPSSKMRMSGRRISKGSPRSGRRSPRWDNHACERLQDQ